jgi:ubiquinone/menaquinone biosynthesis C-methylase UbiE
MILKLKKAIIKLKMSLQSNKPIEIPIRTDTNTERSEEYWTRRNVTEFKRFTSRTESIEHLVERNNAYPGYAQLMPLDSADGKIVLDYGCGPGHDVIGFAEYSNAKKIIGMDVSASALALAEERVALHQANNITFIKINEDFERLPLDDSSIDIIHSSGVIHHAPDIHKILDEFHRILKDDGYCQIMVYNYDSIWLHLFCYYDAWLKNRIYYKEHFERRAGDDKRSLFQALADDPECPIANCYHADEFVKICAQAGLIAVHTGNAISTSELDIFPDHFNAALKNKYFDQESREFLQEIQLDKDGIPCYRGHYAGIDMCFKVTKE